MSPCEYPEPCVGIDCIGRRLDPFWYVLQVNMVADPSPRTLEALADVVRLARSFDPAALEIPGKGSGSTAALFVAPVANLTPSRPRVRVRVCVRVYPRPTGARRRVVILGPLSGNS